jgi:general secretion pathway protein D
VNNRLSFIGLLIAVLGTVSCSSLERLGTEDEDDGTLQQYSVLMGSSALRATSVPALTEESRQKTPDGESGGESAIPDQAVKFPGNDVFVRPGNAGEAPAPLQGDGLVLNFENADLREVVRIILGDFLKIGYIYDPKVQGTVSLQTTGPLDPQAVLETLETLLRMNGAALVRTAGGYRVLPVADAQQGQLVPQLGDSNNPLPPGYSVIIAQLQHISALQMEKVLEPFVPAKTILRVDIDRNLLVLAGTSFEINNLLDTINMFDVDWLEGMSIGLFPLDQVTPETVAEELSTIFGNEAEGPLAGVVRFEPIKRLNALLAITSNSAYLKKIESWIGRLDRGSNQGQDLYVYYLQNGKASEIAQVLTEIFVDRGKQSDGEQFGRLAPGRTPVELASQETGDTARAQPVSAQRGATGQLRTSGGLSISAVSDVRIIADEVNNALLILASPQDQRMVVAAIRKLDVVPLQVLIEATIAEVKLTNTLRFGLQWFFKSGDFAATLSNATAGGVASTFPGFSFVFSNSDAKVVLDALERETSVNIISSPHLMVLDNQTAELQVGDEVPVITQQQQSSISVDASLVNTVEYRDTGVIMRVTPRVHTSGTIIMDVEQEVSNVVPSQEETLTPTISQRKFKSSLVVQSGDTVVLGGLIFDFTTKQRQGLPLLSRLPGIGALFGSTENDGERTELVMLISPRVVRNRLEAKQVTDEVRLRLQGLKRLQKKAVPTPVWDKYDPRQGLDKDQPSNLLEQ